MELLSLGPTERARLVKRRVGSSRKLAAALGVAHTTISRTLRGEMKDELTQARIAKACRISRNKMFGEVAA